MKRAHDKAARGSDANGPWAKRMATDASAGATSRFGFGFRGSISSKSSTTVSDANGGRTTNQAETTAETLVVKEERPESANNNEPSEERNAHEGLRGRGKLTYREKAASRPNVRKSTASALPARSNSRLVLKQHETGNSVPRGLAEPLVALPTDGRSKLVKPSLDLLRSDGKENDEPSNSSGLRVIETFDNVLTTLVSADRLDQMEALLQVRLKAKKFDMKSRLEESQNHNRQLKGGLRTSLDNERSITAEWSNAKQHLLVEISALEAKSKRFSALTAEKDLQITRLSQEIDGIREENHLADTRVRELTQQMNNLLDEHKQASRVRSELEASNQRLQAQLQLAQKANDEMGLELRAYKTTMSDRVQLYEEKKKELEQFYHRKDCEEEKRKTFEIERLQGRVNELKEEIGVANQEKESYRQRAFAAEEEVKKTRDMCAQIEREKCKIEAQYQSQDERLQQYTAEVAQMKAKLDQKDHEISGLVQSLTEIQKLTAASSSKVDSEKQALSEKIEQLQSQLREAERNEATIAAQLREQRTQLDGFTDSKNEWTTKCRDLEGQVKELEGEVLRITRDLSVETGVRQMLESQNRELRTENMAANAQMEAVRLDVKRLTSMHEEAKISWQSTLHDAEKRLEKEKESLLRQIEVLQEEKVSVESEVKTLRERVANVRDADFEELCDVKREAEVLRLRLNEMSSHGSQSIAQKDRLIEELQEKLRQGEKQRRSLHNTIQELRGNVRVFARTRPFLPSDGSSDSLTPAVSCEFDGQTMRLRRQGKGTSGAEPEAFSFTFDKVFSPSVGQDSVFDEVSEFVQSAIDGYHVCLFSYGQTGSGKTHTMQGSGNGQMRGIIPRSIEKVLTECAHLREHGWAYTMKASFLEIYNETLKDLLATKEDANKSLVIKRDAKGGVHVPELTLVDVVSTDQVDQLMERANRARSVACTDMNAQSSRSHSVFTLHLQGVNDSEGIMLDGQLNLVDLAGSERASRSGVSGERLKETQAINKSLSCLADVFTAIGNKAPHIPFRNSKLTYLLQSSLSGDGKTLMMVNVSPTMESAGETLCSLRFAQQVNKCELGKPKRQIKSKKDT